MASHIFMLQTGKETSCQCWKLKRHRSDPWVGRMPWREMWQPLQYSCLQNLMGREVLRVTKSRTLLKQLSMHTLKTSHSKLNLSSVFYRGSKLIDYNEDTHLKHIDFTKTFDSAFYFTEILGK